MASKAQYWFTHSSLREHCKGEQKMIFFLAYTQPASISAVADFGIERFGFA
jgi:hypothetical protein